MMSFKNAKRSLTALILGAACAIAAAHATEAATLKTDLSVNGETILLGDLFADAGEAAHVPVAAAPAPGQSVRIAAWSLQRLAALNGLEWTNALSLETVEVRRASRQLTQLDVEAAIHTLLTSEFAGRDMEIRLNHSQFTVNLPVDGEDPSFNLASYDAQSGRFEVRLNLPSGRPMTVSGTAKEVMQVPVLARPVERGQTISEADLDWVRLPIERLGSHLVTNPDELIGKAAKRPLRSGQPLSLADLAMPIAVAKGALVTMTFDVPGMSLTDTGRATQQGSLGDIIAVLNPRSHRTVYGVITGPDQVRLDPGTGQPRQSASLGQIR